MKSQNCTNNNSKITSSSDDNDDDDIGGSDSSTSKFARLFQSTYFIRAKCSRLYFYNNHHQNHQIHSHTIQIEFSDEERKKQQQQRNSNQKQQKKITNTCTLYEHGHKSTKYRQMCCHLLNQKLSYFLLFFLILLFSTLNFSSSSSLFFSQISALCLFYFLYFSFAHFKSISITLHSHKGKNIRNYISYIKVKEISLNSTKCDIFTYDL